MQRVGVFLAVMALLAAACGGADDTESLAATTTETTALEEPTTSQGTLLDDEGVEAEPDDLDPAPDPDAFDPTRFIDCGLETNVPRDLTALDAFPSPTAGELAGLAVASTDLDLGPLEDWALLEPNAAVYRQPLTELSGAVLLLTSDFESFGLCVPEDEEALPAADARCVAVSGWMDASVFWFGPTGTSVVDIYANGEELFGGFASNGNGFRLPTELDWAIDELLVGFGNPPLSWVGPFSGRLNASGAFSDFAAPVGGTASYEIRANVDGVRTTIPCGDAGITDDVPLPLCRVTTTDGFPTFTLDYGVVGFGPQATGLWRDDELVALPLGGATSVADVSGIDGATYTYEVSVDLDRGRGERRVPCGEVTIGAPPSLEVQLDKADQQFGATWSSPYWYATLLVDGTEYDVRTDAVDLSRVKVSPTVENDQSLNVMTVYERLRRALAEGRDVDFAFHPTNGEQVFWMIDGVEVRVICIEFDDLPPEERSAACGTNNLLADLPG